MNTLIPQQNEYLNIPKKDLSGRRIRRIWNQLSSFQKTFIVLSILLLFIFLTKRILFEEVHRSEIQQFQYDYIKNNKKHKKILNDYHNNKSNSLITIRFTGPSNRKQKAVVDAFMYSWTAYEKYAWGHDNLKPISMTSHDSSRLGLTIVDSLDTLLIMNLQDEYKKSRNWIEKNLQFHNKYSPVNLFDTTIRILGGLLSGYHLSGDIMLLEKSIDLGNRLLSSFDTPSGIPYSDINLATMKAFLPIKSFQYCPTSEVSTLQLEFRDLSRSTGYRIFETIAVDRVNMKIHNLKKFNNLVPIYIDPNTGSFRNSSTITIGAGGDSYYEYLLKQWIQTGSKGNDYLITDYQKSIHAIMKKLTYKTPNGLHVFVGELLNGIQLKMKMDHLTCFLPGTLILGHQFRMSTLHLKFARMLLDTCYQAYILQETGLGPDIIYFNYHLRSFLGKNYRDIRARPDQAGNALRPELIESLYYFYAFTCDPFYQHMGWNIFQAFKRHAKNKNGGYSSIGDVQNKSNTKPIDMMGSSWLSQTLKYFYLLFSDNCNEIDFKKYVLSTQGHLFPIRDN